MNINSRTLTYALWIGGLTTMVTVIGLIVWVSVPMGVWFLYLIGVGVFLGAVTGFIAMSSIQRR